MLAAASGADISASDVSAADVSAADAAVSLGDAGAATSGFTLTSGNIIVICIIVFAVIMLAFEFIRSRFVLSVTRRTVVLDDLPEAFDDTRIAVVSDLHQMRFGEFNQELAKHIRREEPDYILFAGDMGDSKKFNVDAFYDFMDSLGSDIPLIMVPGEHDLRIGGGAVHKNFAREVEHAGALLLNNSCAELMSGESKLYIYGFCPPLEPSEELPATDWKLAPVGENDLPAMLGRCPSDAPVLLLAHDPSAFDAYCAWGADVILCGHEHGGLIRLPYLGGFFAPEKGSRRSKYSGGLYENDGHHMLVTRGLGTPSAFRFLNAPEVSMLILSLPEDKKPAPPPEPAEPKPEDEVIMPVAASEPLGERVRRQASIISDWGRGEARSLRELLYERSIQIRDFFSLMFGKKRSRFAKTADEKKKASIYVAPKKPKPTRYEKLRSKGQFTVRKVDPEEDDFSGSFGTDYDAHMRTDFDDERSDRGTRRRK